VRGLKNYPADRHARSALPLLFAIRERPLNGEPIIIAGMGGAGKGTITSALSVLLRSKITSSFPRP
jgi:putative protein kinase ArgK-like GTPase of G3E family